jgi:maltose O-acetyltransferase
MNRFSWFFLLLIRKLRIIVFFFLSDSIKKKGRLKAIQPILYKGSGTISIGKNVIVGVIDSPYFLSTYCHLEVRGESSHIKIEDNVICNNNFSIICDRTSVLIKERTLIGCNCIIMDSDFHNVDPNMRLASNYLARPVIIGRNVWIGNNVSIQKGVVIGDNSVIASGAIVINDVPEMVIAGGIPAKVIRKL